MQHEETNSVTIAHQKVSVTAEICTLRNQSVCSMHTDA